MHKYYSIALVAVFMTAYGQVLLKLGAVHGCRHASILKSYLNVKTTTGYVLFFVAGILNIYAFTIIELKMAIVLRALTFVAVALASYFWLKETFERNQIIGAALIVAGIILFNL